MSTLRLWFLLRRRSSGRSDPAGLTGVLAVVAFAVTTALALVVVGGLTAFVQRALAPDAGGDDGAYVFLAGFATLLLLVPLSTLGGAAARLAVARRDARLAALRLAGATTGQVTALTVLDAGVQALLGAVVGVAGYGALLPLVARLPFQGRTFEVAELWVGLPGVLAAIGAVAVVALASAASSLGRVAITPLGVAARTTPPALRAVRLVALVLAVVGVVLVNAVLTGGAGGTIAVVVLMAMVAAGMATLNVVGPFVLGLVGRVVAHRARRPATLLAGRRIADDPRSAWRSVGGVALATFIAGITAVAGLLGADPGGGEEAVLARDIGTGGLLTLAIAGVLAGVSTGVMQAGRVIDQRQAYRNLALAGTDTRVLDAARFRETLVPLLAAAGTAAVSMLVILAPLIGLGTFAQPQVLVQYVLSVLAAGGLVLLGAAASTPVARRVVAGDG